jgi:deoxyribose-phosphate aldolase
MMMESLHRYIDHTLLKPEATAEQIIHLCQEAREWQFAAVCVNPAWVSLCFEELKGSAVKVATVIGFPLGANTSAVKAYEARNALDNGAQEIDMVMNIGALKSKHILEVEKDIRQVVQQVNQQGIVKVILENGFLDEQEIALACQIAKEAGAHYVKTSTGFGPGGANVEQIRLMSRIVGHDLGVKASGGVRDSQTAIDMIEAGASRIGTSSGVSIMQGEQGKTRY